MPNYSDVIPVAASAPVAQRRRSRRLTRAGDITVAPSAGDTGERELLILTQDQQQEHNDLVNLNGAPPTMEGDKFHRPPYGEPSYSDNLPVEGATLPTAGVEADGIDRPLEGATMRDVADVPMERVARGATFPDPASTDGYPAEDLNVDLLQSVGNRAAWAIYNKRRRTRNIPREFRRFLT